MDTDQTDTTAKQEDYSFFEDDLSSERKSVPVPQQLTVLAVVLLLIFGSGIVTTVVTLFNTKDTQQVAATEVSTPQAAPRTASETIDPESLTILAKSAFVWDVNTKRVLYEKNPDEQLPLASLTKLMTALVAYELVTADDSVQIPSAAIKQDGESGLLEGETFSFENLSDLTLISSSNDGAFAMAAAAGALLDQDEPAERFIQAMNIRADELGLNQTFYRNPTGLDLTETEAGAYGSARDTAFLVEYILKHKPKILEVTSETDTTVTNEQGQVHTVSNTNQSVNNIPGLIGSKTGYTTLAGGNLAVVFDASLNRPIIVVVLGSTIHGRFTDVLKLSEYARGAVTE